MLKNITMKKQLIERLQELAGIKPLYMNEREGAASNLELKSMAKQLYQRFKKMGADVELTTDQKVINKAETGDLDEKNVFIYYEDDKIQLTLVGEKAIGFEEKIKQLGAEFNFPETGFEDGETWGGQETRNIVIEPGETTSE